jgi:hypothetical protein
VTEEELSERRRKRAALFVIPLLLLGAAFCLWTFFASVTLSEAESFIPAPLGSDALANYGADDIPGRLRSLSISIVEAVIRDRDPEEENVDSRVDDVIDSLKSPVPTVPGGATSTPIRPPTITNTPDPPATPTGTPLPSPSPLPSRTSTPTDVPTAGPTSTSGPSPIPSKTPTPSKTSTPSVCKVPPHIEIMAPLAGEHFTLAEDLPAQAFAYDPDNVNPLTCSTTPATFPDDDGDGIAGDPEVEMRIEWWSGSSWVLVHTEMENSKAYCPFGDIDPFCDTHDLSSGEWPNSTPINLGKHRLKAKVLQDDEGVSSGWVWVEFYIDPLPPTNTPTPSNTPTPTASNTPSETPVPPTDTPIPPPTDTPVPLCPDFSLSNFNDDDGNKLWWRLTNDGSVNATIVQIDLTWASGGDLDKIKLEGADIWNGTDPSPVSIASGWSGGSRMLIPTEFKELRFEFSSSVSGTYSVTVYSDNGCSVSDSQSPD